MSIDEKFSLTADMKTDILNDDLLRHLGEISAGIIHEVRNPLQSIKTMVQAFAEDALSRDDLASYSAELLQQLDWVETLLGDYLRLAKPKAVSVTRVNPSEISRQTLNLVKSLAFMHHTEVIFSEENDILPINADAARLRQVLLNLVLNALDSCEEQGRIEVRLFVDNGCVCWQITDNGCGIAEENLEKVFEQYYTTKKNGTGIGLAICRSIVEAHHGKMRVESRLGEGSVFTVSIPA